MTFIHYALIGVVCCLSGCSTPRSPFQATWYGGGKTNVMYVAILNQSTEMRRVMRIVVNSSEGKDRFNGYALEDKDGFELEPGRVLVRQFSDFKGQNGSAEHLGCPCHVPVSISVHLATGSPDDRPVRVDTIGAMPSALPEGWEDKCSGSTTSSTVN